MKRVVLCLGLGALLFGTSCNKETDGGLPENTWSMAGKVFTAKNVTVSSTSNYISGADGNGSSIDFSFKNLPTTNVDLRVNDVAYTNSDIAVRAVLSGNVVYNSIDNNGAFITVRNNNGAYTVIMNEIKMVNAGVVKDTVKVSANIVHL
jgi:hypothetical protein